MTDLAVDVVVLTWNDGPLLDTAVASVLASEGVDVRLFVIDNGSSPPAVVPDDARVTLVRNEANRGVAPARNQGVALGNGTPRVPARQRRVRGPDQPRHLGGAVRRCRRGRRRPGVRGPGSRCHRGRAPTLVVKLERALDRRSDYVQARGAGSGDSWEVDFGIGVCQLIRRASFDGVGGLDESIFYGPEDVDFCLRIKDAGLRVVQVAASGVIHPARRSNRRLLTRSGLRHSWQVVRHLVRRRLATRSAATRGDVVDAPATRSARGVVASAVPPLKALLLSAPVGRVVGRACGDRIPLYGERIDTANPAISPGTKAQILFRLYERHELRFIRTMVRHDLDVVELGASIGVTGAFLRRQLEPGRRLVCVEANPDLLDTLRTNVGFRAGDDRVVVEQGAVDHSGRDTVVLTLGETTDGSSVGAPATSAAGEGVEVPVVHLGPLLERYGIGDYVLVCDIEGSEAGLVRTEAEALAGCRQLLIELHDGEMTIPELGARIEELGFSLRAESKRAKLYERSGPDGHHG